MSETLSLIIAAVAVVISLYSLWLAIKTRREVKIQSLFSEFQRANQVTIDHPNILNEVHGLDLPEEECRRIAYLSILMDAFQHEGADHTETTFLDKITSVPANKDRWEVMKKIYYGSFDREFIKKIDAKFGIKPTVASDGSGAGRPRRG